jgi:hypothetical protein
LDFATGGFGSQVVAGKLLKNQGERDFTVAKSQTDLDY